MAVTVYTIGHSNRTLDEFIRLLQQSGIQSLIDVRSFPRSRHNPHFCSEALRTSLEQNEIGYHWMGRPLGGMRTPSVNSRHIAIEQAGFQAYADHMETTNFIESVKQLLNMAQRHRSVIMCAEKLPEQCHRNFIADYLALNKANVIHLVTGNETRQHSINPLARVARSHLIYDRHTSGELDF